MAAAGSAVFRPSRGLLILSLLCLLGLGDSVIEMDKMEKLMGQILTMGQRIKYMKADHDEMERFGSEMLDEVQRFLPELQRFLKNLQAILKRGPPMFEPLAELMEIAYKVIERAITDEDWTEDHTEDVAQLKMLSKALRLMQTEL